MTAEEPIEGLFVNDALTSMAEVVDVNDSFARLEIRSKGGLSSSYAMPISEYDSKFSQIWRPATLAEARVFFTPNKSYRPPLSTKGWNR